MNNNTNTIYESIPDIRKIHEERRPGINLIEDRIKRRNPNMHWHDVFERAKMEWLKNKEGMAR